MWTPVHFSAVSCSRDCAKAARQESSAAGTTDPGSRTRQTNASALIPAPSHHRRPPARAIRTGRAAGSGLSDDAPGRGRRNLWLGCSFVMFDGDRSLACGRQKLNERRQSGEPMHLCLAPVNLENTQIIGLDGLPDSHIDKLHDAERPIRSELCQCEATIAMRPSADRAGQTPDEKTISPSRAPAPVARREAESVVKTQQLLVALQCPEKRLGRVENQQLLSGNLRAFRDACCDREMFVNTQRVDERLALGEERTSEQPPVTASDVELVALRAASDDGS